MIVKLRLLRGGPEVSDGSMLCMLKIA
jgi:hypothetical protein